MPRPEHKIGCLVRVVDCKGYAFQNIGPNEQESRAIGARGIIEMISSINQDPELTYWVRQGRGDLVPYIHSELVVIGEVLPEN